MKLLLVGAQSLVVALEESPNNLLNSWSLDWVLGSLSSVVLLLGSGSIGCGHGESV